MLFIGTVATGSNTIPEEYQVFFGVIFSLKTMYTLFIAHALFKIANGESL